MKTWIIAIAIATILLVGGIFVSAALDKPIDRTTPTCTECPSGGCTAINNCGSSTCGATTGGSCGCKG